MNGTDRRGHVPPRKLPTKPQAKPPQKPKFRPAAARDGGTHDRIDAKE